MSIEGDMTTFVTADVAVNAVIANRMYPVFSRADPKQPYIVYRRINTERLPSHTRSELRARVQFIVTCWALSFDAAIDLCNKVRSRVDGVKGLWTASTVHSSFVRNETDNFEPSVELLEKQFYGRDLTLEISFTET